MYWNGKCGPLDPPVERAFGVSDMDNNVADRKDAAPSPERIARANRQRLASEEGARAMADIEQKAAAVRKNMERLRTLREARDAQEPSAPVDVPKKPARKSKSPAAK